MKLALDMLCTSGGTQSRDSLSGETIAEYAEKMQEGATFPPVVAFYDGSAYWLADGFHRVAGARSAGFIDIDVDVHQGDVRAAMLFSVGANDAHGLRRTNADKRRAVTALLSDPEWAQWSDREIARRCGVGREVGTLDCTPARAGCIVFRDIYNERRARKKHLPPLGHKASEVVAAE